MRLTQKQAGPSEAEKKQIQLQLTLKDQANYKLRIYRLQFLPTTTGTIMYPLTMVKRGKPT